MSDHFKDGEEVHGVIVRIFAATRNEDRTEGKGGRIDHSYHLTRHEATIGASGIDVVGSDGEVEPRLALRLTDGRLFLAPDTEIEVTSDPEAEKELREKVLEKLTPAEKAALFKEE